MKTSPLLLLSLALACFGGRAEAAPPPEKLLPKDTLLVVTVPDWTKAMTFWSNQPYAAFWQEPSLKPFKDKFLDKFTTGVVKPLEQSLGVKFSDYAGLARGQITFAFMPITPKDKTSPPFSAVLIIDAKDHAGQLKANLAQVVKRWTDAGKPLKSQKIRETDFTTLFVSPDDLSWKKLVSGGKPAAPPDADTPPSTNKIELTFGQSDSLLLVSDSTEAIDKVLSRQAGGLVPPLEESPVFQADFGPRLRESPFYFWLNAKFLTDFMTKLAADPEATAPAGLNLSAIFSTTGLSSLNSLSLSYKNYPDGTCTEFFLAVPPDKHPALLNIFTADAKDASPPSFVPADAVKFFRWRLDVARSWRTLETMLTDLLPAQAMAQINMLFSMAGKDKDEHYDLKSELLNNFGDDIISYTKPPKANTLADIKSSPTLYLLASPNADKLAAALKVLLAIPFQGAPVTDREFLGRKIYNITPPSAGVPGAATGEGGGGVSFAASGSYLAISGDAGVLEEYLRSSDSKSKTLMDTPGLADAAQRVGGLATGLFGYQSENQTMRPLWEVLRKQNPGMLDIIGVPVPNMELAEQLDSVRQWVDFSLLPPFDAVSKYFAFSVYAGSSSPDGFALKYFLPTPPALRK